MPSYLTKYQIDKIGNSAIYLTQKVGEPGKTKLLKLLFLIEEHSIKEYGTPFFGLDFKIWQYGPVAAPIFEGLTDIDSKYLVNYIRKDQLDYYHGISEFSDDEFSDNDIRTLDWAVEFARHKTAKDLVNYTHSKTSLWRRGAILHGVYDKFLNEELTFTDFNIDFTLLFENNPDSYLLERYNAAVENAHFSAKFKEHKSV